MDGFHHPEVKMRNVQKISMVIGALVFAACPVLGQQLATTSGLRERAGTPAGPAPTAGRKSSARAVPAENRAQHRSLLRKRLVVLRDYLATPELSARERFAVANSVRELEASLAEVEAAIREEAAPAPRAAPALDGSQRAAKAAAGAAFKRVGSWPQQQNQEDGAEQQNGQGQTPQPSGTKKEEERFFDSRRFSLSGGVVISKLERREFQPVLGIARDADGNPTNGNTLTTVIGLKEDNDWTVGPLLLLNTKVWERADRNFGVHGSVGITGKRDSAGTDIDYFFGPSVSFMRGLVFVSGGAYVAKQQRLAGDAFLGAKLEGDSPSVPVVKEYHAKAGFSLTFRIFPLPQ